MERWKLLAQVLVMDALTPPSFSSPSSPPLSQAVTWHVGNQMKCVQTVILRGNHRNNVKAVTCKIELGLS